MPLPTAKEQVLAMTTPAATQASTPAISGVVPPVLTPLTADRELDLPSLERLLGRMLEGGVDGIFALGSTGEVAFFNDAMRDRTLEAITGIVAGQVPVLAGVIEMQTERVRDRIHAAARFGVDGFVVTAPFYAITGPQEIDRHFRVLAADAPAPIWAYDIPPCVHSKLAPELLMALGADGVLAGVKDSSGDDVSFRRLSLMNRAAGSPLSLLTGHEVVVDGAYLSGADGVVPGLGNVDPAGYVRLHRAATSGDIEAMRAEQDRLTALFEIVRCPVGLVGPAAGVGSFKTALRELGVISTNTMSEPLASVEGEAVEAIRSLLEAAGLEPR